MVQYNYNSSKGTKGKRMKLGLGNPTVKNGTNILDIKVPAELEKTCPTGLNYIDDAFGGKGMTPSTVVLFTGTPGSGKTTLMLQLADNITRKGHTALFNTAEESLFQVRKVTKRLRLKHGFVCGSESKIDVLLKNASELKKKFPKKQLFIIVDSLQTLDDGFYSSGHTNSMTAVRCMQQLTEYAKENYAIIIVIGQVKKDGEFSGKMAIKHIVDAHCHLFLENDKKSDNFNQRVFEVRKNRFGCNGIGYVLNLGEKGFRENYRS